MSLNGCLESALRLNLFRDEDLKKKRGGKV